MRLLSFDPLRSIGLPGTCFLKPEEMFQRRDELRDADWVLFPRLWQVNALVYGLKRRIFPSVSSYHLGEDKVEMTRAFQSVCPEHVPLTLIRPGTEGAVEEALEVLGLPLVVKHPKEAEGRGVRRIDRAAELRRHSADHETLYAQELLPIDRDLRIVWVGDRVVAAYWRVAALDCFHNNVARGATLSFDQIPPAAVALVERVATELGVDHAGFDVAMIDDHPYLLELNTLFGTSGLRAQGVPLGSIILDYLERSSAPPEHPLRPDSLPRSA